MNPIRLDDPCVLFALRREREPFCREFRPHLSFAGAPCWAHFCGPAWLTVLVMETGIGEANVNRALDWLLTKPTLDRVPYQPGLLIFAGFAGAADEDLHIGDVVLANEVEDEYGHSWPTTWPGELPAGPWTPPLHVGRLLTVNQLAATPNEKRCLGATHQVCAVDMESAVFAERCTKAEVPFACVRVVSDEVATPLSPVLTTLLAGGAASPWRALRTLARHPGMLPELMRLARDTKFAAGQLGLALGELLTLTLPWSEDPSHEPDA